MKKIVLGLLLVLALTAGFAYAGAADGQHTIQLPNITTEMKQGEGRPKVETYCMICHSLDYITTQPPLSRAQWTATVNKMVKVFGAPINGEDSQIIMDYLSKQYGTGK